MGRRPPLDQLQPRRVCLVKPSALGDVVQALPVLTALRRRWPDAHFAWVVNDSFAPLLHGHPDLDEIIPFPRRARGLRLVGELFGLVKRLRGFDLALDLQGLLRSAALTWLTGAKRRVGFRQAREGAPLAYTDRLDTPIKETPAVLANWSVAQALGCAGAPPAPRLGLMPAHEAEAARQLAGLPRPIVAIHPGASWVTKRWPAEHFAELARRAQRELGAGIVLVGGPGEESITAAVAARLSPALVDLAGKTGLLQLAAVLRAADVMLSNDSGPMHLAAAVGTRVVAPFTCTSPLRAGPFGPGHQAVPTTVSCAASYLRRCNSMACMAELTPDRLWPALASALRAARSA